MLGCNKFTPLHINNDAEFNSAAPKNFSMFVLRLGSYFHYGTLKSLCESGMIDPADIYPKWGELPTLGPSSGG